MNKTKELAELVGIMCGDGCLSLSSKGVHIIYICGHKIDDKEHHEKTIKSLFLKIYGKEVYVKERNDENVVFIRSYDKCMFNHLHSVGLPIGKKYDKLKVPDWIRENLDFSACFVRGLVDTDGCVVFSKQHRGVRYYPRIEVASKSRSFLEEVLSALVSMGFYGSVSKKAAHYRLEIPGFRNLERWIRLIGFNNPKHMRKVENITRPGSDSN